MVIVILTYCCLVMVYLLHSPTQYTVVAFFFTHTAVTVNFDMSTYTFTEASVTQVVCVNITEGITERNLEIQLPSSDITTEG